jgi:hypothetical protein
MGIRENDGGIGNEGAGGVSDDAGHGGLVLGLEEWGGNQKKEKECEGSEYSFHHRVGESPGTCARATEGSIMRTLSTTIGGQTL